MLVTCYGAFVNANCSLGRWQAFAAFKAFPASCGQHIFGVGKVFLDLSALLGKLGRVPTSKSIKTPMDTVTFALVDPATAGAESDKWLKVWNALFLK